MMTSNMTLKILWIAVELSHGYEKEDIILTARGSVSKVINIKSVPTRTRKKERFPYELSTWGYSRVFLLSTLRHRIKIKVGKLRKAFLLKKFPNIGKLDYLSNTTNL